MDEPIHSGKVLGGRYLLGARLGAGGWGSVYAAVQTDLGRPVAIKVLHTSVALAPDGLARFEREAKAAAALGHPNIAQVSDFQAHAGEPPFLVMELLTGGTLGAAIKAAPGRKIAPARMAWIAYQMLAGLDVAHRAGIVHRDIKPDNVFLVAMPGVEDYVKLVDFGIAKLSGEANAQLTSTGTMLGSPAFMAPEQVRSNRFDHRVDVYAVGATMYLALGGRMPFDATTMHGLLLAITEERLMPLHELDPTMDRALSMVVARAMDKDPDRRFPSAADMRLALEPWRGGVVARGSDPAHGPGLVSPPAVAPAGFGLGPAAATGGPPIGSPPPGHSNHGAVMPSHAANVTSPPYAGASATPQNVPMQPAPQYAVTPPPTPPAAKSSGALVGLLAAVVVLLVAVVGLGGWYFVSSHGTAAVAPAGVVTGPTPSGAAVVGGAPVAPGAAANSVQPSGASASGPSAPATPRPKGTPAPGTAAAGAPIGAAAAGTPSGGLTSAPGAAPAAVPSGGARKQFAGTNWSVSGGSFGDFEIDPSKAAIMKVGGAISACYVATEFEPPDHQFNTFRFTVDPAGNVTNVHPAGTPSHPKFEGCMSGALRQVKWAATKAGGSPDVSFRARTRDNQ